MQWSEIPKNPSERMLRQFGGLCVLFFGGLAIYFFGLGLGFLAGIYREHFGGNS